jgi:hypothetical protein
MADPGEAHWAAIKRVFRYIQGTYNYGLVYGGPPHQWGDEIISYTDADFGTHLDRKSVSGFAFLLGKAAISWSSRKQGLVTLLSTESEYVAATHTTKHLIWLRRLFSELGFPQLATSTLYSDNQSAISLSHNDQFYARTKHIDIQFHFVREKCQTGEIRLEYCPTGEMTADIFTKALARPTFEKHRLNLGIMPV